jgi:hypothetical protein
MAEICCKEKNNINLLNLYMNCVDGAYKDFSKLKVLLQVLSALRCSGFGQK